MTPLRRRRNDPLAGSIEREYPAADDARREAEQIRVRPVGEEPPKKPGRRGPDRGVAPSLLRRMGQGVADLRRRALPLPDEVIEDYLATGEQVIHSDHPSFRSFVVENTLLFLGGLIGVVAFLGIVFNGSFAASAVLFVALALVVLVLVLRRLSDRYTSYVVTDSRIMRLKGIVTRRVHSIPWVRVTDLTIEQGSWGRMFGYATLHIESANEDSGLRDLEGVSDPVRFAKYVVDMVVAKQGTTQPRYVEAGAAPPPETTRGLRRVTMSRRRRDEPRPAEPAGEPESPPERSSMPESAGASTERETGGRRVRHLPSADAGDDEGLDPEDLASELRADDHDLGLPWADDPFTRGRER